MNPEKRREIFSRMRAANPQPTTELEYKSDFQLLIAVLLSAQTTDCQILLEQHKGKVPQTREALEALPGVGRKTANVVLNTAFGQPTIAVDTHIFRVSNRTKIAPGNDVVAVEKGLEKFVPDEFKLNVHHWLILHGRYICVARTPKCPQCGIADLCEYRPKTKT